jgi:hypothetical protein
MNFESPEILPEGEPETSQVNELPTTVAIRKRRHDFSMSDKKKSLVE